MYLKLMNRQNTPPRPCETDLADRVTSRVPFEMSCGFGPRLERNRSSQILVDLIFNVGNISASLICLQISDNPAILGVRSFQYEFV